MNIIIRKATLLPAPFVGTRLRLVLEDSESLTWGMTKLTLAAGHEKAVIDWGDATRSEITFNGQQLHAYARTGEYEVRVSDDISEICCSSKTAGSVLRDVYAQMIREFHTNATCLESLGTAAFTGAANLAVCRCETSALLKLNSRTLSLCTSLVGRLDFAGVISVNSTTFADSPGITELHFGKANEEAITALSGYDTAFGAENAVCKFDL